MIEHDLEPRDADDRALDRALSCWADWSRDRGGVFPAWYPGTAVGIKWRPGTEFDELTREADAALGETVDACVESLTREQQAALHVHIFRTRWPGAAVAYAPVLLLARRQLLALLLRRNAVAIV